MVEQGVTSRNVKKMNRNIVYNFIYKEGSSSKIKIVESLHMGISTVSQNIKALEQDGLIERKGYFDSTGGRKADMIRITRTARVSIGVGILKKSVFIVAVDLVGTVICCDTLNLSYAATRDYYQTIGDRIHEFINENEIDSASILGVSIATQGLVSSDGQSVNYGVIMDNSEMKLSDFSEFIHYPCRLEHDSKAAAFLELWQNDEIDSAVVLLLNRNFGSSLIINRQIYQGAHMHGAVIEHMCIDQDGPLCYCGNHGCLETYCSANTIELLSGMDIHAFFQNLRSGEPVCVQIWSNYLDKLAFAMRNLNILIDGHIIISGYLAPFFIEDDISYLVSAANSSPFQIARSQILLGDCGQYTPAAGAALYYIDQFLKSV